MVEQQNKKHIVCVGGGHCNCQVLKALKLQLSPEDTHLTLVTEAPKSYYSGMLPGTVSGLYSDTDLQVDLEPLAKWCRADYVEKRVAKVVGNENKIVMEDGSELSYDVLVLNVGSKTRGAKEVQGVWEHSLTTRPINDLLPKIVNKEQEFIQAGRIPDVAVCGAGAAGTELAFAFKVRWSKLFGKPIRVQLISHTDHIIPGACESVREATLQKLKEHNIEVIYNGRVTKITPEGVHLKDGRVVECNQPIWATGAEPQAVSTASDLDLMKGYFRVNEFLQSTSHPNVFSGGDCITIEKYAEQNFPPKAGVYAVREGPVIANNVISFLKDKDAKLEEYVPQKGFLSLMMTGDGNCIGTKHDITFVGKWVWHLKDHIDMGFMNLFDPKHLFVDYENNGTSQPAESDELFDSENAEFEAKVAPLRIKAREMSPKECAQALKGTEEETEYLLRWQILQRMHPDEKLIAEVVAEYNKLQ